MRLFIANWILKDYAHRFEAALRIDRMLLIVVFGLNTGVIGALTVALAYQLMFNPAVYVCIMTNTLISLWVLHVHRKPHIKIEANQKPLTIQRIVHMTQGALTGRWVADREYADEQSVVTYCDNLIRDKLCYVLGYNIHIPRRVTGVLFTKSRKDFEHLFLQAGGRVPDIHTVVGYYMRQFDISNVWVPERLTSCTAAAVLHEMVHRYTANEAQCQVVTCLLAWCGKDPAVFVHARAQMASSKEALSYWPNAIPKAGWEV